MLSTDWALRPTERPTLEFASFASGGGGRELYIFWIINTDDPSVTNVVGFQRTFSDTTTVRLGKELWDQIQGALCVNAKEHNARVQGNDERHTVAINQG